MNQKDVARELEGIAQDLQLQATFLQESTTRIRTCVQDLTGDGPLVPWTNRIAEMPINNNPTNADYVRNFGPGTFWSTRDLNTITGLTIHHAGSHSPKGMATYCTTTEGPYGRGYPCIAYHLWVSADDNCPIYLLADPSWRLWHDHTGKYPTTLAIALAGYWHHTQPSTEQITATAKLVKYLMWLYNVPIEQVQGHRERWHYRTQCPGWGPPDKTQQSWGSDWKSIFFDTLTSLLPIE